uniref:Uncharacterized protein n=1 Tax=Myoviridae sp. ctlnK45 TaxID=2826693 RepID=A0A8S5NN11_9CAUD|nr:MAG TPA: hypothetical protein [Myoviridae sp. ctlnK45]
MPFSPCFTVPSQYSQKSPLNHHKVLTDGYLFTLCAPLHQSTQKSIKPRSFNASGVF